MGEAFGVRKGHTKHLSSTETTRKRLQSQSLEGQARVLESVGGEETPALPKEWGLPLQVLTQKGCGINFPSLSKHFFMN